MRTNFYESPEGQRAIQAMNRLGVNLKHEDGKLYHSQTYQCDDILKEAEMIREHQKGKHASQLDGIVRSHAPLGLRENIAKRLLDYGEIPGRNDEPGVTCSFADFELKIDKVIGSLYDKFKTA